MIVLASASRTRASMLTKAGVPFEISPPRIDEEAIRRAAGDMAPRDVADLLAEQKARKVSGRKPDMMVLGSDQVLVWERQVRAKARDPSELVELLKAMQGRKHELISAAVIYEDARPVWRTVKPATLHMRPLSDNFIEDYVTRNWDDVRHSVGGYFIEEEGIRLFTRIEGDWHVILGMPLIDVLSYLTTRGRLTT